MGLALALLVGALWTSRTVSRAMRAAEEGIWVLAAAQEVDQGLREFHRLANLWVATGESRSRPRGASERWRRAGGSAPSSRGRTRPARGDLTGRVDTYLNARRTLEARGLLLDQLLPALRPALERAIGSSTSFQEVVRANVDEANAAVHDALHAQAVTVGVTAGLLVVGLAALARGGLPSGRWSSSATPCAALPARQARTSARPRAPCASRTSSRRGSTT
ncbi:MAG: hypothetical protein KIT58_02630 [Planctomycetota bacterium]|nr:hypothetical protein [Planctomycetota bacterium]